MIATEAATQERLAAAQTNPLAHEQVIIGAYGGSEARRYIAAYGEEFMPASLPADVSRGLQKECYKNASLLVLERSDLTYAEGYATTSKVPGFVFMHAWAVDRAGRVVDPTWDAPEDGKYFGVKYDRDKYLTYLYRAKIYGVIASTHQNRQNAIETGGSRLRESIAKGGAGSGNFGHAGRPGEVGGSGAGGGRMMGMPPSHYVPSRPDGRDTRERFSDGHGRYTPERAKLHDEIINKYLHGTTAVKNPEAIIIGGGPGVGKTTLVAREGIGKENAVFVSVDDIRSDLPEFKPLAGKPVSVAETHEEASDISKALTARAAAMSRNILLDGTGDSTLQKLGGKIASLRAAKYTIVAEYVTTSLAEAQRRADARGAKTGRFVPPSALAEMHAAVSAIFPEAVRQGLFDKTRLWDTSGPFGSPATLVASGTGKAVHVHDAQLWREFTLKAA